MSLNLQQGNLCRTELSDGSNVDVKQWDKMFQNSICNGNYEGVPWNMQ